MVLVGIIEIFAPSFVTRDTLLMVLADTAVLFLMATAETFVILPGGIDLSHPVRCIACERPPRAIAAHHGGGFAYPVAILAGIVSGIVHVRLRVPLFVATLATGGVVAGLALLAARGMAITIEEGARAYTAFINATVLGLPSVVLLSQAVGLAGFWVLRYTRFGRYSVAVGAGESAAWAAGVNVNRTKITAFAVSGALAALAGRTPVERITEPRQSTDAAGDRGRDRRWHGHYGGLGKCRAHGPSAPSSSRSCASA